MHYTISHSTLGLVLVAESATGICAVLLGDDPDALRGDLRRRFPDASATAGDGSADARAAMIVRALERPADAAEAEALPLDLHGTAFQREVWNALRAVPAGTTATYAAIARGLGRATSARAVAQACAANPVAVLVPCHRVVRSDGAMAGYRWGGERKRVLLEREAAGIGAGARMSTSPP